MKRLLTLSLLALLTLGGMAQTVSIKWELGDTDNLSATIIEGTTLLTGGYAQGAQIATVAALTKSGADTGYTAVTYSPSFASFTPTTKVTTATAGHDVTFTVAPLSGHKLKVTRISFDCVKVGTDGGAIDAVATVLSTGAATSLTPVDIARNKIAAGNSTGYAHNEYAIGDMVVDGKGLSLAFYLYNINGADSSSPKALALRNVTVEGVMDEEVYDASHYLSALTCMAKTGTDDASLTSLYSLVKGLKNGESARFATRLYAVPTDFTATLQTAVADSHTAAVAYDDTNNTATVTISDASGAPVFTFSVIFTVSSVQPKGQPVALKRGLMALYQNSGNLVSWRARKSDTRNYKFLLFRGTSAASQNTKVNSGRPIMGKTNFLDSGGKAGNYYRLQVVDGDGQVVETEVSGPAWSNQTKYITLEGGAPTDPTSAKATYTPNDASYCDMDGDGEYEIILKWAPSNEKDAASSGTTSPAFYSCYKLDGTRLWMLHTGNSMFNSAHTTPFVAWDLDGDGYGEFMVKTGPGAIDGEGNYVVMDGDDPTKSWKGGNGKQTSGPEYITVFDGTTGAELKTIKYHTAYADESTSFWGDSKQNRSERYLAAIAWLDGEDANPSAIFARGYYNGCKIGAYDWDGKDLTLRWLHRGESATSGTVTYADGTVKSLSKTVYGEGAHWISVADVDGDGRQEITYGAGALKPDGTTLYRTGMEHGDALHTGDFIPSRPGLECFMSLEHKPYGAFLRDATTGEVLWRITAADDTGRGIMAHFNPEADDAYWQTSIDLAAIYDTKQNVISNSISHGGGASLNNRIYWNGNLADDFYDKSVLEEWNVASSSFWRMQVNGGNYTVGTLNNSSKYNPCVLGDLLGDWREEIVNWTQNGDDFQLVINATNYQTDHTLPHLMDDLNYRAQVIGQNDGYNQPPHVSYDPRTVKTIVPETFEVEPQTEEAKATGRYWGSMYTTYPVIIPADVTAWSVANRSSDGTDTLKLTKLAPGKIIPKERAVIFCSQTATPRFVPTSLSANVTVAALFVKGAYCDSLITDNDNGYSFAYEFRNGDRGPGFYRTHGETVVPGGKAFAFFGVASTPGEESYAVGEQLNALWNAAQSVRGDVNGDGTVDVADIAAIITIMAGDRGQDTELTRRADVNGDGNVDVADIATVIDIMAG